MLKVMYSLVQLEHTRRKIVAHLSGSIFLFLISGQAGPLLFSLLLPDFLMIPSLEHLESNMQKKVMTLGKSPRSILSLILCWCLPCFWNTLRQVGKPALHYSALLWLSRPPFSYSRSIIAPEKIQARIPSITTPKCDQQ